VEYEQGRVWRPGSAPVDDGAHPRKKPPAREPFGYVDGISTQHFFPLGRQNPHLLSTELDDVFLDGALNRLHRGGSFMVLRKLEQNVRAFREHQQTSGQSAADNIIGRTPDGTPLAAMGRHPNDFDFSNDESGSLCPFSAHIRRANPRKVRSESFFKQFFRFLGGTPKPEPELHLVRRGVVYGSDQDLQNPAGVTDKVGLLFMAYMSNLDTFRVLQGNWFRLSNFPVGNQPENVGDALIYGLPKTDTRPARGWITPKGGAYLYVPSLPWLRNLKPETGQP